MKHFLINVELTKESMSSVISSKVNACGREVQTHMYTVCIYIYLSLIHI